MDTYKLYICFTHTINGKRGKSKVFQEKTDAGACGIGSSEFGREECGEIGILVREKDGSIVCSYQHVCLTH